MFDAPAFQATQESLGSQLNLTLSCFGPHGSPVQPTAPVVWTSEPPGALSLTPSGVNATSCQVVVGSLGRSAVKATLAAVDGGGTSEFAIEAPYPIARLMIQVAPSPAAPAPTPAAPAVTPAPAAH